MEARQIKQSTQYTGKKCSVCKQTVKVGEMAFTIPSGGGYYRSTPARAWHRDCLAFFVAESTGLVQLARDLSQKIDAYNAAGNPQAAEGMQRALTELLGVIAEKKVLTKKETTAERVEREFKELQAQLQAQHGAKKTGPAVKKTPQYVSQP